jgi:hypothetical protein
MGSGPVSEKETLFNKRWSGTRRKRLRCASDALILGTLAQFRHFRHFLLSGRRKIG